MNAQSSMEYSWHEIDGRIYLVAYRNNFSEIGYPLMDYCIYLSDVLELNASTVRNELTLLKGVISHMEKSELSVERLSDEWIRNFRDQELESISKRPNASRNANAHRRTVNAKIRRLYMFLVWYSQSRDIDWLIGERNCRVTSTLASAKSPGGMISFRSSRFGDRSKFPVLFRRVGERSRHATKYVATEADRTYLKKYFKSNFTEYVAIRNILIMDIANLTGQRREAILSLRCEQFDDNNVHAYEDAVTIVPDCQKFGYEKGFEFPIALVQQIRAFIADHRAGLLASMEWDERRAKGRVFVSARDGRPVTPQAMSAVFGRAFRSANAPRGANLHSFRRKFANDRISEETEARMALGLDTSVASIAASVAISMGHTNPDSLSPYVSRHVGRISLRELRSKGDEDLDLQPQVPV